MIDKKSELIIVLGSIPSLDDMDLTHKLLAKVKEKTKVVLLSTMEDTFLANDVEMFCKYEAGAEEGVVSILAKYLVEAKEIPSELNTYFDELDEGYLSAETNIGEEEFEDIADMVQNSKVTQLIIGRDLLTHERLANIKLFLQIIKKYTNIDVVSLGKEPLDIAISLPEEVEELESFDGTVVVRTKAKSKDELGKLIGSRQFSIAAKSSNNQAVLVDLGNTKEVREFIIDESLKGTIALMPIENESSVYRYEVAKIVKREVQ